MLVGYSWAEVGPRLGSSGLTVGYFGAGCGVTVGFGPGIAGDEGLLGLSASLSWDCSSVWKLGMLGFLCADWT